MTIRSPTLAIGLLLAAGLGVASPPITAQYLGGGTKTGHEAQLADIGEMHEKFVSLGRAFAENAYEWRPMEGVRSVRDVLALIAAETALFPTAWGYAAPAWVPEVSIGPELARLGTLDSEPAARQEARRALPGDVFVAGLQGNDVAWFDGATGSYRGAFVGPGSGGLAGATGLAFGPDGNLYVASSQNHRVLRFHGITGEFLGVLVDSGELRTPFSLIFGPDGHLYVSSGTADRVLRYDGVTGEFRGVAADGGGLRQPIGLAFGPTDGLLYVVNSGGRNILRFDPMTGAPMGVFAADSLAFPSDLAFGPDGDLYVTNAGSAAVVRFDGRAGTFVETRLRLPGEGGVPVGMAFLDDSSLVVGDFGRNRLYRVAPDSREAHLVSDEGLRRPENIAVKPPDPASGPDL